MLNSLFAKFRRGSNTQELGLQQPEEGNPTASIEEVPSTEVDLQGLYSEIDSHEKDVHRVVTRAFRGCTPDEAMEIVETTTVTIIDDLARIVNNWKHRSIEKLHHVKAQVENEMHRWKDPDLVNKRFETDARGHASVLTESLKQIFEVKVRKALRARELKVELEKVKMERRNMLIRLLGDEGGEIKMIDIRKFAVGSIIGIGIITLIEAMLGMPIFRFESSSSSAYWLSLTFAWTLCGFTMVGAHYTHRRMVANKAHLNYAYNYDRDHLPLDENDRVVKPMMLDQLDKVLGYGGTGVLILIAITLLSWRVMISAGMANDGGMGFISAFLLLVVSALMYAGHLAFGPKFALADYRKFEALEAKEAELKKSIKALTDDNAILVQVQNALHMYSDAVSVTEAQVHSDAEYAENLRNDFCEKVALITTHAEKAGEVLERDFVLVHKLVHKDPLTKDSVSIVAEVLDQDRWFDELDQKIQKQPIGIDATTLQRFEKFKPVYKLNTDIIIRDFQPILETTEKESLDKVREEFKQHQESGSTYTPLKLSSRRIK